MSDNLRLEQRLDALEYRLSELENKVNQKRAVIWAVELETQSETGDWYITTAPNKLSIAPLSKVHTWVVNMLCAAHGVIADHDLEGLSESVKTAIKTQSVRCTVSRSNDDTATRQIPYEVAEKQYTASLTVTRVPGDAADAAAYQDGFLFLNH